MVLFRDPWRAALENESSHYGDRACAWLTGVGSSLHIDVIFGVCVCVLQIKGSIGITMCSCSLSVCVTDYSCIKVHFKKDGTNLVYICDSVRERVVHIRQYDTVTVFSQ